jgi:ABC-type sugar transport system permease subunit/ABC-type glycerol-3-phosphate transport system substrate-binding protein
MKSGTKNIETCAVHQKTVLNKMTRFWLLILALTALSCASFAQVKPELGTPENPITIRMLGGAFGLPAPDASDPRSLARRAVFDEFHRLNPGIRVINAGGLELYGDRAEAQVMMAMAGDTAPDVLYVNFRTYFDYIEQGFCRPLDDLIEAQPGSFDRVHPRIQETLTSFDGKVYAAPFYQVAQALYYRRDHFIQAGLDPSKPPRTWDEFISIGRKLTESAKERNGFVFASGLGGKAYWWTNFVWQAGGNVLEPAERGYARSVVGTPEAAKALDFFKRLTLETWTDSKGAKKGPIAKVSTSWSDDVNQGKVSMWFGYTNDLLLSITEIPPSVLGIAAMPAGPAGSVGEINAGMWAINSAVKDPKKLEACWKFVQFFVSQQAAKVSTDQFVNQGLESLVNPQTLIEMGYEDLARKVDPSYVEANKNLFERGHPEPSGRNSGQVYAVLDSALDRALIDPKTDSLQILKEVEAEMNRQLLGYIPPEEMQAKRGWAAGIAISLGVILSILGGLWVRRLWTKRTGMQWDLPPVSRGPKVAFFLFAAILPAALSVLVWSYYPLIQGLVIAFQDYRVTQPPTWVGLDNFISVFTQPIFWRSLFNSFLFVGLSLGIGFFLPLFLALALNEIPRFGTLFRVLFYLPAMTSPLVIAFMWRWFYDKSPEGLLNSLVAPVVVSLNGLLGQNWPTSFDWLGDPKLAMLSVVLPGIWAGAGPGSLLYLAALKNIPEERYEAADLDGANWWKKITRITLPSLTPLMLINLLGAFIGGFKAMENVFVLTGGGPLYSTHTIGLEVWTNAFMFLRFGYASAAAWVMGGILIGFTIIQLKQMTRMKFSTARGT